MKAVLISLLVVLSSSVLADNFRDPHPAAKMVADVLDKGIKIASLKDRGQKTAQLCQLVKGAADPQYIGAKFLGQYAYLDRDADGVKRFMALVPSVVVTRIFDGIDEAEGARVTVDDGVKSAGKNAVEVSARVSDGNNRTYNVGIIVRTAGGMAIQDGKYLGFSAVDYLAAEYKRILDKSYGADPENSLPVSELAEQTVKESGFILCR